jgi:hypothetical protein
VPPPIIVNVTNKPMISPFEKPEYKNVTVYENSKLDGPTSPLYGSIVIMICIVLGILFYLFADWFQAYRAQKKAASKIEITDLTDFELKPIEQQDISADDAHSVFTSARTMLSRASNPLTSNSIHYDSSTIQSDGLQNFKFKSNFLDPDTKRGELIAKQAMIKGRAEAGSTADFKSSDINSGLR